MKTKMKSAFAFIAVALMIMVAVVPMVGVFTEDSSAATTIVPADEIKNITVEGTVYDSETQKIKDVLVKVSYGTYAEYGLTDVNGKYKIPVNFKGESVDLTVDIVTDSADYEKYSGSEINPVDGKFTGTTTQEVKGVTGNVTGIDFMSGYVTISGKLTYANTGVNYDKEVRISVKTVVAEGEDVSEYTSTSKTDGTYSVLVPINSGNVKVFADGFKETGELTVAKANITTGTNLTNKDTYKISVTYGNVFGDNTLSTPDPTDDSKVTDVTFEKVEGKNEYALTYKVVTAEGKTTTNVTFSDEKGYMWDVKKSLSESTITLTEDAYVTGAVKMGTLAILGTDAVTVDSVKFFKGETDTEKTGEFKLTGDGKYVITLGKIDGLKESGANKVKFTATVASTEVKKAMDVAISLTSASTGKDIVMPTDGYYLISGVVKNGTANVNDLDITVTSSNAIGLVDSKVTTGTDGKYAFYAKSGEEVTITPSVENNAVFSPSSYKFIAIANKIVNFEMDSKPLVSAAAVTDAATVPLKDVTVKYRVGETGTFSDATFSNVDSKFTINVGSNVSASNVYVYFEKAGYTFAATSAKPAKMSDESFKANEQTLTFEVKDAAGKDIANISGLALQFAKYKIHAVGEKVNAFDMIGTASDVTYDATTKKFSFIAELIPASADDYRLAYGISVKSNTSEYTFATITEYAENLVIKANEQTFTGKVTDAATGDDVKELKGMTVAVYGGADGKTKLSKDVTTLNDGSFSVISKSGTLKAVDPNGVYTFNDGTATDGVYIIKANEQTYNGEVKDADNKLVKNAKITVKVVDADGKTIGSVATVGKDGKYSIITKLTAGNKVVATDADAKRTFKDVVIGASAMVMPDVVSGQYTLSGTVKEMTSNKAIKDITVTLSTYSATVDPVLVSTAVTNEKGEYSFFVNEKAGYGVVATSSGNYIFSKEETTFTRFVANIVTEYAISTGTVKESVGEKVLSGIKVTAYDDTKVFGEYTTDKNGEFKHPNITGMKFKAIDPNGAYTFADEFTTNGIKAKEKTVIVTITANDLGDGLSLAGVTVNFLKDEKVVKTATTDAKGKASVIIATSAFNKIKAVDGNTAYGAMTFATVLETAGGTIEADQTVYSGFYANGDVVSGVVVTYEMSKDDAYVEKGKAVVIDNKYYIASAATAADKIVITANAQGFYAVNTFDSLTSIGISDLKIKEKPGIVKVDEDDVLFGEFYTVYNATNAQVGDKIILRASEVAYAPLEDGNETTVVKYKFNGWYVNGVKVSDDLEYVYTVTESCLVYADYKASTYETVSDDNGISPSVLVIGIAAVIVALIAVVYTVIQKKE